MPKQIHEYSDAFDAVNNIGTGLFLEINTKFEDIKDAKKRDLIQARIILETIRKIRNENPLNKDKKIGITFSASLNQTRLINDTYEDMKYHGWKKIDISGGGQAGVMREVQALLETDPDYTDLRNTFRILPVTTMDHRPLTDGAIPTDYESTTKKDLINIKEFYEAENIVLAWKTKGVYAIGGGIAGSNFDEGKKQKVNDAFTLIKTCEDKKEVQGKYCKLVEDTVTELIPKAGIVEKQTVEDKKYLERYDQTALIAAMNRFLSQSEFNEFGLKASESGICAGLDVVYFQYVLNGEEEEFFRMIDIIIKAKKPNYKDKKFIDQISTFTTKALFAFDPSHYK